MNIEQRLEKAERKLGVKDGRTMNSLSRRLDSIEKQVELEKDACLHFPCPDGTCIDALGCHSLVDLVAKAQQYRHHLNNNGNGEEAPM